MTQLQRKTSPAQAQIEHLLAESPYCDTNYRSSREQVSGISQPCEYWFIRNVEGRPEFEVISRVINFSRRNEMLTRDLEEIKSAAKILRFDMAKFDDPDFKEAAGVCDATTLYPIKGLGPRIKNVFELHHTRSSEQTETMAFNVEANAGVTPRMVVEEFRELPVVSDNQVNATTVALDFLGYAAGSVRFKSESRMLTLIFPKAQTASVLRRLTRLNLSVGPALEGTPARKGAADLLAESPLIYSAYYSNEDAARGLNPDFFKARCGVYFYNDGRMETQIYVDTARVGDDYRSYSPTVAAAVTKLINRNPTPAGEKGRVQQDGHFIHGYMPVADLYEVPELGPIIKRRVRLNCVTPDRMGSSADHNFEARHLSSDDVIEAFPDYAITATSETLQNHAVLGYLGFVLAKVHVRGSQLYIAVPKKELAKFQRQLARIGPSDP